MESFKKLGLSEGFINLIREAKFEIPSEIQQKAIPLVLDGKDIIGGSATGSGKTLAFGAGIIEKTLPGQGIQALILTPTRELAEQVGKVLKHFSSFKKLNLAVIYGGVGMAPQIEDLEIAEIVVATPGRLLDLLKQGNLNLKEIKTLVLDEADRMLDMGFIEDVDMIIKSCPIKRQTLLFSATISLDISHLAKKYMKDPINISVDDHVDPKKLKQVYYDVPKEKKLALLIHLLSNEKEGLVMVFCNTRSNTDFVSRNLHLNQIDSMAIHGGLSQQKRSNILEKFHSRSVYVLVCTDVAARGLDIKGVSHVYNYDIPKSSKEYVHRIGRTARAGAEGIAINVVSQRDYENFRNVMMDENLKIEKLELPLDLPNVKVSISYERRQSFNGLGKFGEKRRFDSRNRSSRFRR